MRSGKAERMKGYTKKLLLTGMISVFCWMLLGGCGREGVLEDFSMSVYPLTPEEQAGQSGIGPEDSQAQSGIGPEDSQAQSGIGPEDSQAQSGVGPENSQAQSGREPENPAGQSVGEAEGGAPGENEETSGDISITISATGDVTLGNYKGQSYGNSFREAYDKFGAGYFLENVKDLFEEDDMTIVNLEGPLTLSEDFREGQIYSIKGDPEYVEILTQASVEAAAMGNNHRLDYREQGSDDTVKALEEAGIVYAFDDNVGIYETNGIRIGFVAVNEFTYGYVVETDLKNGIAKLQEEGADLILACCHWGTEHVYESEEYQKSLGRKCIDWGADLVIGHHPHVLQGIDSYNGRYIVYSLGNFCFGANRNPSDKDTMIFRQTFTFTEEGEKQYGEARIIPCSISSVTSRNDFRPTPAEGEEFDRILQKVNEYSEPYHVAADEEGVLQIVEE